MSKPKPTFRLEASSRWIWFGRRLKREEVVVEP